MQSKGGITMLLFLFSCLCVGPLAAIGAAYFYFQDQPPNRLSDSGYYFRRTKVYYYPGFGLSEPFEIPGADLATFKILDSQYALDASRVYLSGQPIPQADAATFEVLGHHFSRDANHVYLGSDIFSDDPGKFELLLGSTLVRDSKHIYWGGNAISDDPTHLEIISRADYYTYIRDSKRVFVNGNPIQGAVPSSFEVISAGYSRDAEHIFYFASLIPDADLATFEVIESPYARDERAVFWMGKIIPNAAPESFRVLNANFECSADAARAYYQNKVIQGVDASTIPPGARATNCSETWLSLAP